MHVNRKKEIRIFADNFREKCKVRRYGIIDLFKECERMGYKLFRYPLGEDSVLGFTIKKDTDLVVFTNTCSRLSREIFTLAHEIGHINLHMVDSNEFIDNTSTISDGNVDEKEQEANYFAACLLMPEEEVEKFLALEIASLEQNGMTAFDIARIMSEFSVSFDMALNRLENLGRIDHNQKLLLDNEKTKKSVGNLLRSVGGNARLNSPSQEIDMPFEFIDYVIYNYNHNAIPKETLTHVLDWYRLSEEDVSDRISIRKEDYTLEKVLGGLTD